MIKKILNEKEKEIFDYTARPFIIYCIIDVIIIAIGLKFGNMTADTANGHISSMALVMLINYLNMCYIEIKTGEKK